MWKVVLRATLNKVISPISCKSLLSWTLCASPHKVFHTLWGLAHKMHGNDDLQNVGLVTLFKVGLGTTLHMVELVPLRNVGL